MNITKLKNQSGKAFAEVALVTGIVAMGGIGIMSGLGQTAGCELNVVNNSAFHSQNGDPCNPPSEEVEQEYQQQQAAEEEGDVKLEELDSK